ncbi:hypothetical protein AALO_G00125190 [Alosa alosa]|uniref:Secreted protein n=1 Tax=Alosa alosa TaxID=278164 RepID=A0AAV6GN35_9TELE|nr:hypothetical protein AALO_G00125190 [Alosa alosa]
MVIKTTRQLFFLWRLRCLVWTVKYCPTSTIESILTGNITAWYGNSTAHDRKALQRVVRLGQRSTLQGLSYQLFRTFTASAAGERQSGSSPTPVIPATVSSPSYHLVEGTRTCVPIPADR